MQTSLALPLSWLHARRQTVHFQSEGVIPPTWDLISVAVRTTGLTCFGSRIFHLRLVANAGLSMCLVRDGSAIALPQRYCIVLTRNRRSPQPWHQRIAG